MPQPPAGAIRIGIWKAVLQKLELFGVDCKAGVAPACVDIAYSAVVDEGAVDIRAVL
jgi:hypothetical protein